MDYMDIIYHEIFLKHIILQNHIEAPKRLEAILDKIKNFGVKINVPERYATINEIAKIHDLDYINLIKMGDVYLDSETFVHKNTFEIASYAVYSAIKAVEQAYNTKKPVFALIRPPGHHANKYQGSGFCYFNNAAIAVVQKNFSKLAVVDIDLHHGNGTSDIFYSTPNVLYISTHQYGIYPGTGWLTEIGTGAGEGYTVNIPLPTHTGDTSYKYAFEKIIIPILQEYKPEMIVVSFGADAHYMDPLSSLTLSTLGYIEIVEILYECAKTICNSRLAFVLEGGYNVDALSECVAGIICKPAYKSFQYTKIADKHCHAKETIEYVAKIQKQYWKL